MNVLLAPDKQSATVNLTAKVTSSEDKDFQVQELRITLKKVNGEWLIFQIEIVRTLSQMPTSNALVGMGNVTLPAGRRPALNLVARICNPLYRRIVFGSASLLEKPAGCVVPGGLQIRDTAETNSALLRNARLVDAHA